jgi:hypothetical protein
MCAIVIGMCIQANRLLHPPSARISKSRMARAIIDFSIIVPPSLVDNLTTKGPNHKKMLSCKQG